jgi:predicted TIM-barrel fold metal-dependent hydrolase
MYSVDYPFATNERGLAFVEELQNSKMVSTEELDLICFKNAEKLLGVKAKQ